MAILRYAFLRYASLRYGYLRYAFLRYAFLRYASFRDGHLQNRLVAIQLWIDAFMIWTILFQILIIEFCHRRTSIAMLYEATQCRGRSICWAQVFQRKDSMYEITVYKFFEVRDIDETEK